VKEAMIVYTSRENAAKFPEQSGFKMDNIRKVSAEEKKALYVEINCFHHEHRKREFSICIKEKAAENAVNLDSLGNY